MTEQAARGGGYRHTQQRRERLLAILTDANAPGSVRELAAEFGVSVATIRRDLTRLQNEHRVARTYGGAIAQETLDRPWRVKSAEALEQKRRLARWAADRVPEGATVLLDAGTTVAEVAALLGEREDVQLVTNGLSSLLALADARAQVTVLGGRLRRPSESIIGALTLQTLERITADVVFLGAEALDPVRGINCPEGEQAVVKEAMVGGAREAWVLADSQKLERTAQLAHWARISEHCGLATDDGVDPDSLAPFEAAQWRIEIVGSER